jgi:hypothetical protein
MFLIISDNLSSSNDTTLNHASNFKQKSYSPRQIFRNRNSESRSQLDFMAEDGDIYLLLYLKLLESK